MPKQYSITGNTCNIKKDIWKALNDDPLLSPLNLAKLLDLPYRQYRNYITKERSNWKYYHENEQGSKCSSFHCYKAKVRLDRDLSDSLRGRLCFAGGAGCFVGFGWQLSKARNRFLITHKKLGRVVWFETGSVRMFVKKPGSLGKAKQLFCDAFVNTGLITDVAVFNPILERVSPKSCHFPYVTPQRLPYVVINDFADSHGIIIKVGDRSHPNAIEVIAEFTAKQDELEAKVSYVFDVFQQVNGKIDRSSGNGKLDLDGPAPIQRGQDYSC